MLRLILEATAAFGYMVGSVYHTPNLFQLPIPIIGLTWLVLVRFIPPFIPDVTLFWVTYALLVYQLVSFHDLNACLLDECETGKIYSYITVASTFLFWSTMSDSNAVEYAIKKEPEPEEPKVTVEKEVFPSLKIRVQPAKKNGPIRLNMGESFQAKWV